MSYQDENLLESFIKSKRINTMINSKLLSKKIYAHPENIWALTGINIDEAFRKMMISIGATVLAGQRLSTEQMEFADSKEYAAIQHECDLISGEYHKILGRHAQRLMKIKGYIKEGDFEVCDDRYYIVKPAVYSQHEGIFTSKNRAGTIFFIKYKEVEDFANKAVS